MQNSPWVTQLVTDGLRIRAQVYLVSFLAGSWTPRICFPEKLQTELTPLAGAVLIYCPWKFTWFLELLIELITSNAIWSCQPDPALILSSQKALLILQSPQYTWLANKVRAGKQQHFINLQRAKKVSYVIKISLKYKAGASDSQMLALLANILARRSATSHQYYLGTTWNFFPPGNTTYFILIVYMMLTQLVKNVNSSGELARFCRLDTMSGS